MLKSVVSFIPTIQVKQCDVILVTAGRVPLECSTPAQTDRQADGLEGRRCQNPHE